MRSLFHLIFVLSLLAVCFASCDHAEKLSLDVDVMKLPERILYMSSSAEGEEYYFEYDDSDRLVKFSLSNGVYYSLTYEDSLLALIKFYDPISGLLEDYLRLEYSYGKLEKLYDYLVPNVWNVNYNLNEEIIRLADLDSSIAEFSFRNDDLIMMYYLDSWASALTMSSNPSPFYATNRTNEALIALNHIGIGKNIFWLNKYLYQRMENMDGVYHITSESDNDGYPTSISRIKTDSGDEDLYIITYR